jgi:glycosyltransferase involved in cell wall biosynthesis
MLILTNFERFPEQWRSSSGKTGESIQVRTVLDILRNVQRAELILINCDVYLTMQVAALFLFLPFLRRPVLSHDLVLRPPRTWKARLTLPVKRFLLARVDHFTLHFRDLSGYQKHFGIRPERCSYTPFKPNIRFRYEYTVGSEGDYILCFGRSERDYDSFFAAMAELPDCPAAIPPPDFPKLRQHGSRFSWPLDKLPPNVRILEDDGTNVSLIRMIERARLVVLPILGGRISPSGIGTYLNAMLLGKCVILTEGTAASDVFTDEVILVPPENPQALRDAIRRAWDDDDFRRRTALAGQRYSESCGGEPELRQRVLDLAIERLFPRP